MPQLGEYHVVRGVIDEVRLYGRALRPEEIVSEAAELLGELDR